MKTVNVKKTACMDATNKSIDPTLNVFVYGLQIRCYLF